MKYKPNLLCIVPPYAYTTPPLGSASLLGYLRANGCHDFDFLDLRLWTSITYAPTYRSMGTFGESFVIDIPDLPLVLALVDSFQRGTAFSLKQHEALVERFALDRGLSPTYLLRYVERMNAFLDRALVQIPDVEFIGFSVWASNLLATLLACAHLKRRAKPPFIVLGGPQVTESRNSAALALRAGLADVIVRGEGEASLLAVYQEFRNTGRAESVPGTVHLTSDNQVVTPSDRPLMRIKEKPLPDFSSMPILDYQQQPGVKTLPFELSRGCTDKCTFCSEWAFWQKYRPDSPEHVVEQIAELLRLHQMHAIQFADSLLNGVPGRINMFAEGLLAKNISIKWGGFFRAQMDDETAALLKRSGCHTAFIGVESFDDDTLADMNKRMTAERSVRSVTAFLDAGFSRVTVGYIPGFPGDTRARFIKTAKTLRALQEKYPARLVVNVEPFVVSPGQALYRDLAGVGLEGHPWSDEILDLAPAFRDVTENILCSVTGSNQGVERLGQTRIAQTLAADADYTFTRDAGLHAYAENLRDRHFMYRHVFGDWWLARYIAATGNINAFLISTKERDTDGAATANAAATDSNSEAKIAAVAELWRRKQLVCPTVDITLPGVIRQLNDLPQSTAQLLQLSPFCVVRDIEDPKLGLLLIDHHTGLFTRAPRNLTPLVRKLATSAIPLSDVYDKSLLPPDVTSEQLDPFLKRWLQLGIAVAVGSHELHAPPPPTAGPIRTNRLAVVS